MTVRQIYDHAVKTSPKDDSESFTAVLLATVTKFDLDGFISVIAKKWFDKREKELWIIH